MNICVYAGSRKGLDENYAKAAKRLGSFIGKNKHRLIYGAGNRGLMGVLANSVLSNKGMVTGVIPRKLVKLEAAHDNLSELIITENMHQRKAKMCELAEIFVVLPGGIGTFDELFEILCWNQLEIISKPLYIININNYYDPLKKLIEHTLENKFTSKISNNYFLPTVDNLIELLT